MLRKTYIFTFLIFMILANGLSANGAENDFDELAIKGTLNVLKYSNSQIRVKLDDTWYDVSKSARLTVCGQKKKMSYLKKNSDSVVDSQVILIPNKSGIYSELEVLCN